MHGLGAVLSMLYVHVAFSVELPPKKPMESTLSVEEPDPSIDLSRQLSLKLSGPLSPAALKSVRGTH